MKTFTHKASHGTYTLGVEVCKYRNGQNAIELVDMGHNEPFMTASVSVEIELKADEVAIKDYSENQGILSELIKNGVVSKPHKVINSGFVTIPICKLLM